MLALGIAMGNPWFAVPGCWMLTCGAFVWMLRPWFFSRVGFLRRSPAAGADTAVYWSDSYWGGALAALSAAIIVWARDLGPG
jgi:hypothetical protein